MEFRSWNAEIYRLSHNHQGILRTWLSLVINPDQPSFLLSPQDGILYLLRADESKFLVSQPTLVCPWLGVHRTSFMSLLLLLQQCSASLAHLSWLFCVIGNRCFVGYCIKDLFQTTLTLPVLFSWGFSQNISWKSKWCCHTLTLK